LYLYIFRFTWLWILYKRLFYIFFYDFFYILNIRFLRVIHVGSCNNKSFISLSYVFAPFFHSTSDGHGLLFNFLLLPTMLQGTLLHMSPHVNRWEIFQIHAVQCSRTWIVVTVKWDANVKYKPDFGDSVWKKKNIKYFIGNLYIDYTLQLYSFAIVG
jgi:hypothetical protein